MRDIVLAVNYRPEMMVSAMKEYEEKLGITVTFSVESEPFRHSRPTCASPGRPDQGQ